MNDIERSHGAFQFSLWSLLVFSTFVAVLCSIGVCTDWAVPLIIIVGIGICFVGFGRLSMRKHPEAGFVVMIVGFLVRLTGLALIAYGLLAFVAQVAERLR